MTIQNNKKILIHSKNTTLNGIYSKSSFDSEICCLILPNHPTVDGNMNNPIVRLISDCFRENGFVTLMLNFHTAFSSGKSTKNNSNNQDMSYALDALEWLSAENPDCTSIWVAGFGYGADICIRAAMRRPNIDGFICVSPIFNSQLDFSSLSPCPNGLIIAACEDKSSDWRMCESMAAGFIKQKGCDVKFFPIQGADKNYTETQKLLSSKINSYLADVLDKAKVEKIVSI